jgi:hypothetical protein
VDPIRPITSPTEVIPPVIPAQRVERAKERRRDPREQRDEQEREPEGEEQTPPDDEHPHVDVSA